MGACQTPAAKYILIKMLMIQGHFLLSSFIIQVNVIVHEAGFSSDSIVCFLSEGAIKIIFP